MTKDERKAEIPFSGEANVSPWDFLLAEVRRSAYRSQWVDQRVEVETQHDRELGNRAAEWDDADKYERMRMAQGRELREWIKLSREERAHGAQVARAAVSAGLSERYIESVQAEAQMIANVLQRALQAAQLSPEQWLDATEELRIALAEVGRELNERHASVGHGVPRHPMIEG